MATLLSVISGKNYVANNPHALAGTTNSVRHFCRNYLELSRIYYGVFVVWFFNTLKLKIISLLIIVACILLYMSSK